MIGVTEHITSEALVEGLGIGLGVVGLATVAVIGFRSMYNSIVDSKK